MSGEDDGRPPTIGVGELDPGDGVVHETIDGRPVELAVVPDLYENFYGISVQRRYELPLIGQLLNRSDREILDPPTG